MITPAYAITATERVLPRLALDFTTGALDPRITFTRALNTATRVNSGGFIELINANLPRFDYDPITLACKGLLLEESRANLVLHSQAFNDVYWSKSGATITADAAVSPDGTANADALVENTATSAHSLYKSLGSLTGTYTQTCYVEAAGRTWCYMEPLGNSATRTFFNLSGAGSIGTTGTGVTARITAIGGGFYRIETTYTYAAQTGVFVLGAASANATPSYTGNGAAALYLWGAQVEEGAFATSYIPTTTTALTRNADVATITGTNFSDWFNASEGTLSITGSTFSNADRRGAGSISDGTTSNCVELRMVALSSNNASRYLVTASGAASCSITASTAVNNTTYSLVGSYKTDSFAFARGGALIGTDSLGAVPTVNQFKIGTIADGSSYLNGYIQKISYWPQQLTTAEVTAFSK